MALVITDTDVGGAERALVALGTRLDRRRWRPKVFCLGPEGKMVGPLREAGLPPVCLSINRRLPLQGIMRLAAALREHAPQLVQSFLFHANFASRLAAPLARVPWVLSGIRVAEHQKRWHLTLDRLTARLTAAEVCVSRGVMRFSRDVEGISPERLIVIPNGVDPAVFDRAEPLPREAIGVPADAHMALCIGRLDVQKGLLFLLDAAERVIGSRSDWHLVLVGDGLERDWLLGRIAASPFLTGRVHWVGRRDDTPRLLKAANLLVLASLWEGMPNVVLEAMAARRAVVATDVEGSEELVLPGQTGWLVPPRNDEALSQALLEAAANPDLCARFGQTGRARVASEYTFARMVRAYECLWAGILGFGDGCPITPPETSEQRQRS